MTSYEIARYYAGLLIIQYIGKPKAYATIEALASALILPTETKQLVSFSGVPTSGSFKLSWNGNETSSLTSAATASTVQTALRALAGLSAVTVSGSFSDGFSVSFVGVPPVAEPLIVTANSLTNIGGSVSITIAETDRTLPLLIEDGYNLSGDNTAVGVQLDVLGKYAGVVRTANGFTSVITLGDADFLQLIRIAILQNSAQSDLGTIQELLATFFPGQIYVVDYTTMRMSYLISSSLGSQDLIELFITQKLLPVPMAVGVSVIYAPVIDSFFGFCDYTLPVPIGLNTPLNDWLDYQTDWPWLDYNNTI